MLQIRRLSLAFYVGAVFDIFPHYNIGVFCNSGKGQASLALGGQLLFLYVLECEIRHFAVFMHIYYLGGRPAAGADKNSRGVTAGVI